MTTARQRVQPLPLAEWDDEERSFLEGNLTRADRYLSGDPDAPPLPAILGLFARHPRVAGPWLGFNGSLLQDGTLDARDRELLILRVAIRTRCRYEWQQHLSIAEAAGLTGDEIAAVTDVGSPRCWNDRDGDLLLAADQLVQDHTIDDIRWDRLARHFDERQLLEICFVIGSYTCLAMVLNAAGLSPAAPESQLAPTQPARPQSAPTQPAPIQE
jgi:AhpD family alkylhydroperoxidase